MAGTNLGTAYVQIMPSAKGISGSISEALGGEASAAGESAGASIVGKIKGAIAAAGLGKLLMESLNAGGDLQQSFGGLDTLYGEAAEGAKKYALEASQAGISANDYAEQAVSFGAALKSAYGGDTYKAMEAANTAIMDMADNSAKMGTDIGAVQTAYQGFAKQNYTMLDNLKLGYGGTKSEMERLLEDAEKLSGVHYNIDNLGDVYDAIHVIQEDLGLTGVAAQEAGTTFTGSFGAMKAAATNFLASLSLGENVTPALTTLLESVGTFMIGNLLPMVLNIVTSLPEALSAALTTVTPQITEAANVLPQILDKITEDLPGFLDKGVEFITNLSNGFMQGAPDAILKFGEIITKIYDFILQNGPVILSHGVQLIGNLAQGFLDNLPAIVGAMATVAKDMLNVLIENLPNMLQNGKDVISNIASGIKEFISDVPDLLKEIGSTALEKFRDIEWKELGSTIIGFLKDGIDSVGSSIWDLVKTIGQTAWDNFKEIDWNGLGSSVINFVTNGIRSLVNDIPNALRSIGEDALGAFTGIDWAGMGWNVIQGIIDGLWKAVNDPEYGLFAHLRSIGEGALGFLCGLFGIESPSKVFRDQVGKMIPLGIAEGIDAEASAVTGALDDIASDAIDPFGIGSVGYSGSGASMAGIPGAVNIPITINAPEGMDVVQLANKVSDVLTLQLRQTQSAWSFA